MNVYTTEFFATCPNNGIRILYRFRIETTDTLQVEAILARINEIHRGLHEGIADHLSEALGGLQTLTANHHGVTIETTRSK